MTRSLPALAALLLAAAPAQAGKVKAWQTHAPSHYEDARLKHAVVTSEGAVRLGRDLRPLPVPLDAAHAWDVCEDAAGGLLVATGSPGRLLRVAPTGEVTTLFERADQQVLSVVATAAGVFFGTGPDGGVWHAPAGGKPAKVLDGVGYAWSLAADPHTGTVYAGCGPHGAVYRVEPDGRAADVYFQPKHGHVLSVAVGPDGTVYAGSDTAGVVYRVAEPGKARVVFQAAQAEVRRLLASADGVYAATSSPAGGRKSVAGGSKPAASSPVTAAGGKADAVPVLFASRRLADAPVEKKSSEPEKGAAASSPSAPSSGENSVYRIAPDGTAREVFRAKGLVLGLARPAAGRLVVGTGLESRLYEVDERTREKTELARLDHGQILGVCRRADGRLVLAAGDPGKLYELTDRHVPRGTVESEVFDAKLASRWGAMTWRADAPAGTSVTVAVRSGNVAEPDDTWSDWSPEEADPARAAAAAPPGRYLQYRATLASADPARTPALHSLTVKYAGVNLPPEVTSLDAPDLDAVTLKEPKKLKLKWSANDANEDELAFDLYVRKDGWKDWVRLEEGLAKAEYEWDTSTVPAGTYLVRVVASDRPDNPEGDALTGERRSAPVLVAHEPPAVTVRVVGVSDNRAVVEATAADPAVRLASAAFALDGKKWTPAFPADGLFDGKAETFRFQTEPLTPGAHVVVLRVKDAAGNVGSADAVFTVRAAK